ncbi:MAG: quinone-dependent dihydroorotate dehydrogenase [Pseudomonadota bacterium]
MAIADLAATLARTLPPETAHSVTIAALKRGVAVPSTPPARDASLAVRLPVSGLELPNPVGLAAGFDKNAEAYKAMLKFGFGFVECGTVTPQPQAGNPKPRLFRLKEDQAVINRMGFNNKGLAEYTMNIAGHAREEGILGANVGANKTSEDRIADYVEGLQAVWPACDYITLNISSPNTPGLRGLQDKGALEDLLGRCGEAAKAMEAECGRRGVFLKVAPDVDETAIAEIAAVAKAAPYLHGLIVSNTTLARPDSLVSAHAGESGGLSGAPLMAPSTEVLRAFAGEVGDALDLIGVGGISSAADVRAKLDAGAQAVQLYSALAYNGPGLVRQILDDLAGAPGGA